MANIIAVAGASGSGKSSSLKNLDPNKTFVISILGKRLPFRGSVKNYQPVHKDENGALTGNFYKSTDIEAIKKIFKWINDSRPEITTIAIDDSNYLQSNEVMSRSEEKGWN